MKKIVLGTLLILTFACQKEAKEQKIVNNIEEIKEIKNEFIVKIAYKTDKADTFQLVLYNIVEDEFQSKWIQVNEKVNITDNTETLTVNFGDNISNNFRINFGNKEEKEVEIEYIEISYGEKAIIVSSSEMHNYFKFNEYVSQEANTNKLITTKINEKLNPIIYFKVEHFKKLQSKK